MKRPRARLLLAFVPAILFLSACGDTGAASVSRPASSPYTPTAAATTAAATASPVAVVTPSSVATPVVAKPIAAAPVRPADPYAAAKAAGASAVCADGTWSFSKTRSGTCSHHGGVHWWTGNLGPAGPGAH
jgi:serine/threonine-protein kinase